MFGKIKDWKDQKENPPSVFTLFPIKKLWDFQNFKHATQYIIYCRRKYGNLGLNGDERNSLVVDRTSKWKLNRTDLSLACGSLAEAAEQAGGCSWASWVDQPGRCSCPSWRRAGWAWGLEPAREPAPLVCPSPARHRTHPRSRSRQSFPTWLWFLRMKRRRKKKHE